MLMKEHCRNDRRSMGKKHKDTRGRSSKYWRGPQDEFGWTEKQNHPQFFPQVLNYISFQSGLHCLFIASTIFLSIKFLPHHHYGNI